jgi:hypothetical protein
MLWRRFYILGRTNHRNFNGGSKHMAFSVTALDQYLQPVRELLARLVEGQHTILKRKVPKSDEGGDVL